MCVPVCFPCTKSIQQIHRTSDKSIQLPPGFLVPHPWHKLRQGKEHGRRGGFSAKSGREALDDLVICRWEKPYMDHRSVFFIYLFWSSIEECVQQTMFDYRSSRFSIFGFAGYFATGVLDISRSTKVISYASRYALGTCSAGAPPPPGVCFHLARSQPQWLTLQTPMNPGRNRAKAGETKCWFSATICR